MVGGGKGQALSQLVGGLVRSRIRSGTGVGVVFVGRDLSSFRNLYPSLVLLRLDKSEEALHARGEATNPVARALYLAMHV